ncbi:hypothetical protein TH44_07130 [Thalassospira xiamenensis]|uniref:HTH cro/C1-type domain-containing protein n=2 Tax=Thalassospira xiamenensis TaxID=220697 RepID=A0A367XCC1_9PROT|nr:helix-turn-helix transcriptional regulator [Thalassospira xiamenensis]KZB52720.1 hypothetical protein AUP41_03120 [Thalassospira xiamenensis]RCK51313.1 hypothetical protein TH44_07130 [Thalassospira xiamenensis]
MRDGRRKTKIAGPHPIDLHVGKRLRELRMLKGLGQSQIAKLLGITFQQVQKYERGANRVSASRLYDIAEALGVPISYFYDDIPPDLVGKTIAQRSKTVTQSIISREDPMQRRETLELVRCYYGIEDEALRYRFFELLKSMSNYADRKIDKTSETS